MSRIPQILLSLGLVVLAACPDESTPPFEGLVSRTDQLTVFYTNDLHSHFRGTGPTLLFTPEEGDDDPVRGHYARLAAALTERRKERERAGISTLVLDAGDFYSGSVFATIGPDEGNPHVPEFEFFHMLNYDAITLGNHEFDAGLEGLSVMLEKAASERVLVPLLSNVKDTQNSDAPREFVVRFMGGDAPIIRRSMIKLLKSEHTDLRVGIIGAMGPDALNGSLLRRDGLAFHGYIDEKHDATEMKHLVSYLEQEVKSLKGKTDFIIVMFHGAGTSQRQGSLEEVTAIAESIPDIDLIVSGHTHDAFDEPKIIQNTHVVQAGEYGMFLGAIDFVLQDGKVLSVENELISIDDTVESDPRVLAYMEKWLLYLKATLAEDFDRPVVEMKEALLHRSHELSFSLAEGLFEGASHVAQQNGMTEPQAYVMLDGYVREGFPVAATYSYADVSRIFDSGLDRNLREGSAVVIVCAAAGLFPALWAGGVRIHQPGSEYSDWNIRLGGRQDAWTTPLAGIAVAINQPLAETFQSQLPEMLRFTDCETGRPIQDDRSDNLDAYQIEEPKSGRVASPTERVQSQGCITGTKRTGSLHSLDTVTASSRIGDSIRKRNQGPGSTRLRNKATKASSRLGSAT